MRTCGSSDVSVCRRQVVSAVVTGGIGGIAGCSAIDFGDPTPTTTPTPKEERVSPTETEVAPPSPTPTEPESDPSSPTESSDGPETGAIAVEGFESGETGLFTDSSQSAVSPAVTSDYAADGQRALYLPSLPGTQTRNSVDSVQTWTGPKRYSVFSTRLVSDGPENSFTLKLRDGESDAQLELGGSGYFGGYYVKETDSEGIERQNEPIASGIVDDRWTDLSLTVRSDRLIAMAGRDRLELTPALDWTSLSVNVRLSSNAWGSGDALETAFDDFRIEHVDE